MKPKRKWEVEWVPKTDVEREHAKRKSDGSPKYPKDEWCEAAEQCYECRDFPTKGLAMAFARKVVHDDFFDCVAVKEIEDEQRGSGWEQIGETVHISSADLESTRKDGE